MKSTKKPASPSATPDQPEAATTADRALIERPAVTIRLRIGLIMGTCFFLTALVTLAWIISVGELGSSQQFLEQVNRYVFELEQTRRYEKNYLLYGTNLNDALSDMEGARQAFARSRSQVCDLVGDAACAEIEKNLSTYGQLLEQLGQVKDAAQRKELEPKLRRSGAQALDNATQLADQERLRVHTTVHTSKLLATASLVVLLLVIAYLASSLARQILGPLGRYVTYTQRIASGDFSPILPVRRYKDEFSDLALAINTMLDEIQSRQAQITRTSRMAAVGTLTAGIAHELNNPLNNISLTTEAMIDAFEDYTREEKLRMLNDIFTQVQRGATTVRNLLDFTRVEKPVLVSLAVGDVLKEAARLVANEAMLSNVQIDVDVPPELPRVRGNPRDLQQVFINMFLNAIQAMPEGGQLLVRCSQEGDDVRIDVADNGMGIAEENLSSIFDPFYTTKEVGQGTGLGLSVSYGIVEKHGGRIEVQSVLDKGTTFSVFLPSTMNQTATDTHES